MTSSETPKLLAAAGIGAAAASAAAMMIATKRVPPMPSTSSAVAGEQLHRTVVQGAVDNALRGLEMRLGSKLLTSEREIGRQLNDHSARWLEKLSGIDQTRDSLDRMQTKMEALRSVFAHPKQRGSLGEIHLERLVSDVFPSSSYEFQSTLLGNGKRPDCILKMGGGEGGKLCIDSKFPLDAYQREGEDAHRSDNEANKIKESLKKHIRDVSTKYILPGETADYAVLFIPSESIFLKAVAADPSIVVEAHRSRVWLASPTTLIAILTTLRGNAQRLNIQENVQSMLGEVAAMDADLERLSARAAKAEKCIEQSREALRLMNVSMDKVARRRTRLLSLGGLHYDGSDEVRRSPPKQPQQLEQAFPLTDDHEVAPGARAVAAANA